MATYSRNNLPAVRETPAPLASRDIGEIIVRSLTTVQESLNEEHVPVNKRDIEDAIVKGINKSELNKKYKPGGIGGKGSSPDSEVEKYYREKRLQMEKDRLDKENRESAADRDKYYKKLEEKTDKFFNETNLFFTNPLKSFSNFLDKTLKKTMVTAFNPETYTKGKELIGNIITNTVAMGVAIKDKISEGRLKNSAAESDIDELISDDNDVKSVKTGKVKGTNDNKDELDELLETNKEENKKEDDDRKEQKKHNDMTSAKIGLIVGGVLLLSTLIPLIIEPLLKFINGIPDKFKELRADIGLLIDGPNSIGNQIKLTSASFKTDLGNALKGVPVFGKAGDKLAESGEKQLADLAYKFYEGDVTVPHSQEELDEAYEMGRKKGNYARYVAMKNENYYAKEKIKNELKKQVESDPEGYEGIIRDGMKSASAKIKSSRMLAEYSAMKANGELTEYRAKEVGERYGITQELMDAPGEFAPETGLERAMNYSEKIKGSYKDLFITVAGSREQSSALFDANSSRN